ncbi:MAG TPA: methylglyoxal synthase [Candidatus Acidoferrales bacterium]|nr:methylglyoxal synthase [Candidatus Acidoferrales bacterium]
MIKELRPHVAIIAHDGKQADLVAFAAHNRGRLKAGYLVATATTSSLTQEKVGLAVHRLASGPLAGSAHMAARVAGSGVDAVFFIVDPLGRHHHDPDIQTRLPVCTLPDVPLAIRIATADILMRFALRWEKARVRATARNRDRTNDGPPLDHP